MKKNKIVITYGSYDLLHRGHINLLRRSLKFGDKLYVGLSSEKFNKLKNKKNHESYSLRKKKLLQTGMVEKVFAENNWKQKEKDIKKYKADIFVMGSDWKGKFDYLKELGIEVVYLKRTKLISSTKIRKKIEKKKSS